MTMGIGVSAGIGYAQAMLWHSHVSNDYIPRKCATPALEVDRFETARRALLCRTQDLRIKAAKIVGDEDAAIFDAYSMVLDDEEGLLEPLRKMIRNRQYTAEYAVTYQFSMLAQEFLLLEDEYMRQRVDDVLGLRDQLLRELMGQQSLEAIDLTRPTIIIAKMLGPGDIANLNLNWVEGIVCETGGYSSHTAIIARNLGIPAILGAENATKKIASGELVAIDGESGELWIDPSDEHVETLRQRSIELAKRTQATLVFRGRPTISADGHRIELAASVSHLGEVESALACDAESLGMYRTELLFQCLYDEEDQYNNYSQLLQRMGGKTVTVRTFDNGGSPGALKNKPEENPALGCRGIRLSLARPSMFRTQLRALLRASAQGPLRILFPMISGTDELKEALTALEHVKSELEREHVPYDKDIPVGVYVTVPAAALMADVLAQDVDFLTVGINDLIQFTVAVERNNADLGGLYHLYHPAVLRLLKQAVDGAHKHGIPCHLSGEPPGFEKVLPVLLGLGFDGLIQNPSVVLRNRQILSQCCYEEWQKEADELLKIGSSAELTRRIAHHG